MKLFNQWHEWNNYYDSPETLFLHRSLGFYIGRFWFGIRWTLELAGKKCPCYDCKMREIEEIKENA